MARTELVVSEEEAQQLKRVVKRHTNWRMRERAQMLLLLAQGKKATQVALEMGLHPQTVGSTRRQWDKEGMASLSDKPRSGAPAKLSEPQVKQLVEWASTEPLSRTTLKARHEEAGGVVVHVNTLTSVLKRAGLVWKRTRHSLQKRDQSAFAQADADIVELRKRAEAAPRQGHCTCGAHAPKAGHHPVLPARLQP